MCHNLPEEWLEIQLNVMAHLRNQGFVVPVAVQNVYQENWSKFNTDNGGTCDKP